MSSKNTKNDIYGGINPIFESLRSSVNEAEKTAKKDTAIDTVTAVVTALNTMFTLLLSSKMEEGKTVRGFDSIKNKILGTDNFGSFRQYLISFVGSLSTLDPSQKQSYDSNIKMITSLLGGNTEAVLSDPKTFKSIKNDTISKVLGNFLEDIKEREKQMRKTNPKLFGEVIKQGLVVKEAVSEKKKSGDETDASDAEFRGQAFNKSKESLDAANSFVGMIDRDKYIPTLKDNRDIERYKDIADSLYKKAQDLQMLDRAGALGGKIVTATGEFKAKDYKRKQDDLINEIIRQKKEYERLKSTLVKIGQPISSEEVCPAGQKFDKALGKCVDIEATKDPEEGVKPPPKPVKDCTFPVKLNQKCNQVGELQGLLMNIIPSASAYLKKFGGKDKVYGKGTAAVTNIVWGYLTGESGQSLTSDLTQEMYDSIMKLTEKDIDASTIVLGENKSIFNEMDMEQKIQEREEIEGSPILSFDDFFSVIEETYRFNELDEQSLIDKIKSRPEKEETPKDPALRADDKDKQAKKIYDDCVKKSLEQGKVLDCVKPGEKEETKKEGEDEKKEEIVWKGFKPVNDGAYTVYYDESWGEWFSDVGKGALVAGLVVGAVVVTAGAASIAIPVGGTLLGASSLGASGVAGAIGAAGSLTTTAGAITLATGAIGGTTIAKWAGDDRKPVTILVFNGYIEEIAVRAMARGLYNSLGGTVSSQDLLAIYSTLLLCRGTFTGDTKAVSVWRKIKSQYASFGGGSLEADITSIISGGAGGFFKDIVTDMDTIPGFPKSFKTKDPIGSSIPAEFEDAKEACVLATGKLNSNETKLSTNLKNISEEDLEMLSDGMEEITTGVEEEVED